MGLSTGGGTLMNVRRRDFLYWLPGCLAVQDRVCALLLDIADRRLLSVSNPELARRWLAAPGSAIKPFTLLALLESGKLTSAEQYPCPRRLVLNSHSLNCSHPDSPLPMNVSRAIAYSCNCAVAHFSERFEPGELPSFLQRMGLASATGLLPGSEVLGRIDRPSTPAASELQALGENGLAITPLELLLAYRRLALRVRQPLFEPVLEGLEGAVEFGTAQCAMLDRIRVAGKTGSLETAVGHRVAWFAGFAPSRAPEVAVTVLVQGRSGGADAAPIAGELLRAHFAGRG